MTGPPPSTTRPPTATTGASPRKKERVGRGWPGERPSERVDTVPAVTAAVVLEVSPHAHGGRAPRDLPVGRLGRLPSGSRDPARRDPRVLPRRRRPPRRPPGRTRPCRLRRCECLLPPGRLPPGRPRRIRPAPDRRRPGAGHRGPRAPGGRPAIGSPDRRRARPTTLLRSNRLHKTYDVDGAHRPTRASAGARRVCVASGPGRDLGGAKIEKHGDLGRDVVGLDVEVLWFGRSSTARTATTRPGTAPGRLVQGSSPAGCIQRCACRRGPEGGPPGRIFEGSTHEEGGDAARCTFGKTTAG